MSNLQTREYRLNARIDINKNLTAVDYALRLNKIDEILDTLIESNDISKELEILNKNFDNKYATTIPSYINELHLKLNKEDLRQIQKKLKIDKTPFLATFERIGEIADKVIDVDIFSDYVDIDDISIINLLITTNPDENIGAMFVDYIYRDNVKLKKKCLRHYQHIGLSKIYVYNQYGVIVANLLTRFLQ